MSCYKVISVIMLQCSERPDSKSGVSTCVSCRPTQEANFLFLNILMIMFLLTSFMYFVNIYYPDLYLMSLAF